VVAASTRIVRTCQGCQFYARQTHLPAQALQTIPITWPFAVWGLDLVGPLQKAPRGFTHLLVAIDKFSKWIEVRPLNSIRFEQEVAFFTNIIHRFGVPNSIITDNGTQFTGRKFLDFCEDHHIRVDWAAVAHPMMNGQVERANNMILQGLKPRIYNVAEPPKLLAPHAPVLVSKTSDSYACAPDNLTGSVRLPKDIG
jgi:transposase InsO family protein